MGFLTGKRLIGIASHEQLCTIGFAFRADFRRLYPANAKTPTCCPSDDNRTKVTKLCDVSTVPLVARWPVFLARGSNADGEPHSLQDNHLVLLHIYRFPRSVLLQEEEEAER